MKVHRTNRVALLRSGYALSIIFVLAWLLVVFPATVRGASSLDPLDTATVQLVSDTGLHRTEITVSLATDPRDRYEGLSKIETLPDTTGMLFVFPDEGYRTFVMDGMSFPIDIIFFGENGRIRKIYHAPLPTEKPEESRDYYRGRAKWILEVNLGWSEKHNLKLGDSLILNKGTEGP